jgi:hypothetical protein
MKSDLSRETFDHLKHYSSVRMQQGRVQVDADWNEQARITLYRIEREAADLIGGCGGPIHNAGFEIKKSATTGGVSTVTATGSIVGDLAKASSPSVIGLDPIDPIPIPPNDFLLTKGRYYVDGILCEIDSQTLFSKQPDLPHRPEVLAIPVDSLGNRFLSYLAYLDVWRRNITALDDPKLREVALGGPDTSTRKKTIWQVKLAPVTHNNCIDAFAELKKQKQPSSGQMSARTAPTAATTDPCIVPSTTGFRGLENQFYRIEIHNPGTGFDISTAGGGKAISLTSDPTKIKVTGFKAGQAVELFLTGPSADTTFRKLFYVVGVDSVGGTITLNSSLSGVRQQDAPQIRAVGATFKWSRDNGSVVTLITKIDNNDPRVLTVLNVGNDRVTGFAPDQWVELIDDTLELNGLPGQLLQIAEVDQARQLITLKSPATPLSLSSPPSDGVDPAFHPKLRRWDGVGAVDVSSTGFWTGIENGIQVSFAAGSYQNGDYWTVPARTATADAESGNIEWPQDANKLPLPLSPFGIDHHYCPLAMLDSKLSPTSDCRRLFPPVTELTTLYYVDGDGQEAMPGDKLPRNLQVRVANGQIPVIGAQVTFKIIHDGAGKGVLNELPNTRSVTVTTIGPDGIAECSWTPDPTTKPAAGSQGQQVEARLLDAANRPIDGQVVRFNADLSIASEVSYDPGSCANLQGKTTVQDALDTLSKVVRFIYIGGNAQFASSTPIPFPPDPASRLIPLAQPLEVGVFDDCGPATGRTVEFTIKSGRGQVQGISLADFGDASQLRTLAPLHPPGSSASSSVDAKGIAACHWEIDPFDADQIYRVEVTLQPVVGETPLPPIQFTAAVGEPGFQITNVRIIDTSSPPVSHPLRNDTAIRASIFAQGSISIDCSAQVDPGIVRKPTCFVTLEIPFPVLLLHLSTFTGGILSPLPTTGTIASPPATSSPQPPTVIAANLPAAATKLPAAATSLPVAVTNLFPVPAAVPLPIGYQPFILESDLSISVAGNSILWKGKPNLLAFFNSVGSAMAQLGFGSRILARLTVKGNFITAAGNPSLYLDGEVFGLLSPDRNTDGEVLRLLSPGGTVDIDLQQGIINGPRGRSGDGKRGGDFEMWFFLDVPVTPPLQVSTVTFVSALPGLPGGSVLTLNLPPLPAQPVPVPPTSLTTPPVNTIDIGFNRLLTPNGLGSSDVKLEQLPTNAPAKTLTVSVAKTTESVWRLSLTAAIGPAGPPTLLPGQYRLTISKGVLASDNTLLDGAFTNEPGTQDFQLRFTISDVTVGNVGTGLGIVAGVKTT